MGKDQGGFISLPYISLHIKSYPPTRPRSLKKVLSSGRWMVNLDFSVQLIEDLLDLTSLILANRLTKFVQN